MGVSVGGSGFRVALTCALLIACGDEARGAAATFVDPPEIPWLGHPEKTAEWTCPEGWHRAVDGDVVTCEPYPAGGPLDCPDGEAHFPGEPACAPVGRPCTASELPSDDGLPPERRRIHALRLFRPGGDGSATAPFDSLSRALDAATPGSVILLGAGVYSVDRPWPSGVWLRGRCAAGTSLVAAPGRGREAVVDLLGSRDVRLEDVTIAPEIEIAVRATSAAELALDGVRIRGGRGSGILSYGTGTVVRPRTVTVDGVRGFGIAASRGGRLEGSRLLVSDSLQAGVILASDVRDTRLEDFVVRRTRPGSSRQGWGLAAGVGCEGSFRRVLVEDNRELGVSVSFGADVTLEDFVVRGTATNEASARGGQGLHVFDGGKLTLARGLVDRNQTAGVHVTDLASEITMEDVVVRDTASQAARNDFGRGVSVSQATRATLRRVLLDANLDVGLYLSGVSQATLEDVVARGTGPQARDGAAGRGVVVQDGGDATLRRIEVDGGYEAGISMGNATVVLEEVAVHRTEAPACAPECPVATLPGVGISAFLGATVDVRGFEVADAFACGLLLSNVPAFRAERGFVHGNPTGVCVQGDVEIGDLARVTYEANGRRIARTDFAIPPPVDALPRVSD